MLFEDTAVEDGNVKTYVANKGFRAAENVTVKGTDGAGNELFSYTLTEPVQVGTKVYINHPVGEYSGDTIMLSVDFDGTDENFGNNFEEIRLTEQEPLPDTEIPCVRYEIRKKSGLSLIAPVINRTEEDKTVTLVAAAYKDNKCIKTEVFENYLFEKKSVSEITTHFGDLDADCVKMFIWDDLKGMRPIAEGKAVQINEY